jgi:transketolase
VECEGKPDIILVANGSEVGTLADAAKIMEQEKKIKARIVSAPSIGLFFEQPESYRESVILPRVPVFGLTAGLPVTLQEMVGPLGMAAGLDRFGASAPYKVLDEKFGFTAEKVKEKIYNYLDSYEGLRKKLL